MQALKRLLFLFALGLVSHSHAELVVVVDAKSGVDRLSRDEVINIFLGRHRKMPTGIAAIPVDQPVTGGLRGEFYHRLVDKDQAEINAYWARLFFSGKTSPPLPAASAADVLALVIGRPGGIGYIERTQVDSRLRVVLEFAP